MQKTPLEWPDLEKLETVDFFLSLFLEKKLHSTLIFREKVALNLVSCILLLH